MACFIIIIYYYDSHVKLVRYVVTEEALRFAEPGTVNAKVPRVSASMLSFFVFAEVPVLEQLTSWQQTARVVCSWTQSPKRQSSAKRKNTKPTIGYTWMRTPMRDHNFTDYLKIDVWSELLHEKVTAQTVCRICKRKI